MRSEESSAIDTLGSVITSRARSAVDAENARRTRGSTPLDLSIDVIGDRPTDVTPATDPLVVAGVEATRLIGRRPALVAASTDANVPMALGIPAIAIGAGGYGGEVHLATEWYENEEGPLGLFHAALVIAAAAGFSD